MKKVVAINGSPRKRYNTATLLNSALEGARAVGADTEYIDLIDLEYRGCISCFACKSLTNPGKGKCNLIDDLYIELNEILKCDAIIVGSPIYLGDVTGITRSFLERLLFPFVSYDKEESMKFDGKIDSAFIFTMNCPEDKARVIYDSLFQSHVDVMKFLNGSSEYFIAADTYQFDDYSKYAVSRFNLEAKAQTRDEVFPETMKAAFELGQRLGK